MRKKGHAAGIAFIALVTLGLIAAGVGTTSWTVATIGRNQTNGEDCIVIRSMGLFRMTDTIGQDCISGSGGVKSYDVRCKDIVEFNDALQYSVIAFCGLSMLACLIIMSIAAFNICENPYQTFLSAFGLLIYNVIGLCCSLLAVVLYVALLYTDLQEPLNAVRPPDPEKTPCVYDAGAPSTIYKDQEYEVKEPGYFGFSFFLVMTSIFTYGFGVALSILAEKKPMEKIKNTFNQKNEEAVNQQFQDTMMF